MKIILTILGIVFLILGIVGIFLPVLPTTPFLLLSAWIFFRTSPQLYDWLINQKYLGTYIRNFREKRAIPLHAKIISTAMIWITLTYCTIFIASYLWMKLLFLILAIVISTHILSYKTLK